MSTEATPSGPLGPESGLGLHKHRLAFVRARPAWLDIGRALAAEVAALLGHPVEHIGSTSVPGLVCKPIIDLAVGWDPVPDLDRVARVLSPAGWIYRGDAGDDGGHVYVLEREPLVRVAHLHGVDHGGAQWRRYLQLRDRLRSDPAARRRYESTKLALLDRLGERESRRACTDGKTDAVAAILGDEAGMAG